MTGIAGQAIGTTNEQLKPVAEGGAVTPSSRGSVEPFIGFFRYGTVSDPAPVDFTANEDNVTAASDGLTRFAPSYSGQILTWVDVTPNLPQNTVPPAVTGTPQSGNTLTCSPGTWTGADGIAFRWYRNGIPTIGQTSSTFVVVSPYIGDEVGCVVTASNAVGVADAASNVVTILP